MLKEIYEQPKAIRDTLTGRISKDNKDVIFEELGWEPADVASVNRIFDYCLRYRLSCRFGS